MALYAVGAAAQNSSGLRFEISTPEGRTVWMEGEPIPITMRLSSAVPNKWVAQASAAPFHEQIRVWKIPISGIPLEQPPGLYQRFGGVSGGPRSLSTEPFEFGSDLNESVAPLSPGTYRIEVTTGRVYPVPEGDDVLAPVSSPRRLGETQVQSNTLTIQIIEATAAWQSHQLNRAQALLDNAESAESPGDSHREGQRILRYLGTEEAGREMIVRLGSHQIADFSHGLRSNPHGQSLLAFMTERLVAHDQSVGSHFVNSLAGLAARVQEDPVGQKPVGGLAIEAWSQENARRRQRGEERIRVYYDHLAAALERKTGTARSVSASTLADYARNEVDKPAWHGATIQRLRESFSELPRDQKEDMLSGRWYEIAGPEMLPLLRTIIDSPVEPHEHTIHELAARRFLELDPVTGRQLIVEQILGAGRELGRKTVLMLDEETLPEAFPFMEAHLRQGSFGADRLILRYGDAGFVELAIGALKIREQQYADANQSNCLSLLHVYLLKHAPETGIPMFREAFASGAVEKPHCLSNLAQDLPLMRGWSPSFQIALSEVLLDGTVSARQTAAELLGLHGSASAEQPLWETMEVFRDRWSGREAELTEFEQQNNSQIERTLRIALAQGAGWMLDAQGMSRLRSLCGSEWCTKEVDGWIRASEEPLVVEVGHLDPERLHVSIGRFGLRSREQLIQKIEQFPPGTRFRWGTRPGANAPAPALQLRREIEGLLPGLDTGQ